MNLNVTLEELYSGTTVEVLRHKPVAKAAKGMMKCNCHFKFRHQERGPGRYNIDQLQICDKCPKVELFQEERPLKIKIEPGMREG